jgi:hypothetical protein
MTFRISRRRVDGHLVSFPATLRAINDPPGVPIRQPNAPSQRLRLADCLSNLLIGMSQTRILNAILALVNERAFPVGSIHRAWTAETRVEHG